MRTEAFERMSMHLMATQSLGTNAPGPVDGSKRGDTETLEGESLKTDAAQCSRSMNILPAFASNAQ